MAYSRVLIQQLLRVRTTTTSKIIHPLRLPLRNSGSLKSYKSPSERCFVNWKLYAQKYIHFTKSYNLGREFSTGKLLGVTAVLGSFFLRPRFAHCIDGYASSVDDRSMGVFGESETDDNPHNFMIYAKKLMVPIALLLIVWTNWNYPFVLGVKVILTLLATKPSPFSVYVFIEQLQKQYRGQHPVLHKLKSFYAKKVDVEDYTVFCIAKVEIGDQMYTLLGILGGWWVFEMISLRSAFSDFKSRMLEMLDTAVSSDM